MHSWLQKKVIEKTKISKAQIIGNYENTVTIMEITFH